MAPCICTISEEKKEEMVNNIFQTSKAKGFVALGEFIW